MKTLITNLMIIASLLTLISCGGGEAVRSDQLKRETIQGDDGSTTSRVPIHRSYSVTYDENEERASLYATFRTNNSWGAFVELVHPSRVTLDNIEGEKVSMSKGATFWLGTLINPIFWLAHGTGYSAYDSSAFQGGYNIHWTDTEGLDQADRVTIKKLDLELSNTSFEKGRPLRVSIGDVEKASGVEICFRLTQGEIYSDIECVENSYSSNVSVTFDTEGLVSGNAKLTIEQKSSVELSANGNKGGTAYLSYISRSVEVSVY